MVEQEFKDTEIQLDEAENSEKVEESNHQIILTPEEIEALFEQKVKNVNFELSKNYYLEK